MENIYYSHVLRALSTNLRKEGATRDELSEKISKISKDFLAYYKSLLGRTHLYRDIDIVDEPWIIDSFLIDCDENLDNIKVRLSKTAFLDHLFDRGWSFWATFHRPYIADYVNPIDYYRQGDFTDDLVRMTCDMEHWTKKDLYGTWLYDKYLENKEALKAEAERLYPEIKKEGRRISKRKLQDDLFIAAAIIQLGAVGSNMIQLCEYIDQVERIDIMHLEGIDPDKVRLYLADLITSSILPKKKDLGEKYYNQLDTSLGNYFEKTIQEGKTDVFFKSDRHVTTFNDVYERYKKYHPEDEKEKPKVFVKKD